MFLNYLLTFQLFHGDVLLLKFKTQRFQKLILCQYESIGATDYSLLF